MSYATLKDLCEFHYEDRKSEFIAFARPVSTESEALDFIGAVKKKYPDARHWVYAYVLRENSTARFTDDREPQGTAGMPVLDAIRKNGVTDCVIVVVRYFGGILLGTGGLVHAYSSAALGALRGAKIIHYNLYTFFDIYVSYGDYQKISAALNKFTVKVTNVEYSDNVKIKSSVESDLYDDMITALSEVTSGRIKIEFLDNKYDFRE